LAKTTQWEGVINLLEVNHIGSAKFLGLGGLFQVMHAIEDGVSSFDPHNARRHGIDQRELLARRDEMRRFYPRIRELIIEGLPEMRQRSTALFSPSLNARGPGSFDDLVRLGDPILIEACLVSGVKATKSGTAYPLETAFSLIGKPETNPDSGAEQPKGSSRKVIFRMLVERVAAESEDSRYGLGEAAQRLGRVMVNAVRDHGLIEEAEKLWHAGADRTAVTSHNRQSRGNILHAIIIAKSESRDSSVGAQCDAFLGRVLEEALNNRYLMGRLLGQRAELKVSPIQYLVSPPREERDFKGEPSKEPSGFAISPAQLSLQSDDWSTFFQLVSAMDDPRSLTLTASEWHKLATFLSQNMEDNGTGGSGRPMSLPHLGVSGYLSGS
jgi:hypothetical protein